MAYDRYSTEYHMTPNGVVGTPTFFGNVEGEVVKPPPRPALPAPPRSPARPHLSRALHARPCMLTTQYIWVTRKLRREHFAVAIHLPPSMQ
jgi:hypothetical protein